MLALWAPVILVRWYFGAHFLIIPNLPTHRMVFGKLCRVFQKLNSENRQLFVTQHDSDDNR